MTMDKTDTGYWYEVYEKLSRRQRSPINDAFTAAHDAFRQEDARCGMDDRAEHLVAALTRYYVESNYADADQPGEAAKADGALYREGTET